VASRDKDNLQCPVTSPCAGTGVGRSGGRLWRLLGHVFALASVKTCKLGGVFEFVRRVFSGLSIVFGVLSGDWPRLEPTEKFAGQRDVGSDLQTAHGHTVIRS
jgi:hypothetical protein